MLHGSVELFFFFFYPLRILRIKRSLRSLFPTYSLIVLCFSSFLSHAFPFVLLLPETVIATRAVVLLSEGSPWGCPREFWFSVLLWIIRRLAHRKNDERRKSCFCFLYSLPKPTRRRSPPLVQCCCWPLPPSCRSVSWRSRWQQQSEANRTVLSFPHTVL